jgi:hypothetical protein
MCWGHDPASCYGKRVRDLLFNWYKQEELSGAQRSRIFLAVRAISIGVCFNVFVPRMY